MSGALQDESPLSCQTLVGVWVTSPLPSRPEAALGRALEVGGQQGEAPRHPQGEVGPGDVVRLHEHQPRLEVGGEADGGGEAGHQHQAGQGHPHGEDDCWRRILDYGVVSS